VSASSDPHAGSTERANAALSPPSGPSLPARIVATVRRDVPLAVLDLVIVVGAYLIALVVRVNGVIPPSMWQAFWRFLPVPIACHLASNFLFQLYGQMWRYASVREARQVLFAGLSGGCVVILAGMVIAGATHPVPIFSLELGALLSLMGFGAIRFQSRLFAFRRQLVLHDRRRILIVGAGDAGSMLLKDLLGNPSVGLDPVALVDDDPRKVGLALHGVRIVGRIRALPKVVERLGVAEVLLAIPSATSELVREVVRLCEQADVGLRVLPSVREAVGGKVTARDIRDLRIEDLLGRQQVRMDLLAISRMLRGRRVLVTGAGGSIGSEISRQVAGFDPASLVLLDHDETHLHDLAMDLEGAPFVEQVLADIRDPDRVLSVLMAYRPEVVFHAAAHKHVPVLEAHPQEALLTNVIGTANLADAALATGVKRFVLISTDKAVHPESVMGSSKRFAELIVGSLHGKNGCRFCAVRFGNVLGSRGSVIPTFLRQIQRGGPVTVTDPSMTRYFMSVQEAVQLVLQAATLSRGGEVFTLDMGEPVKIIDLARRLIRLSGRVPDRDIQIAIVGTRPGEKMAEEVVNDEEESLPSGHPSIVVSQSRNPDRRALRLAIREMEDLSHEGRLTDLALRMKELAVAVPALGRVEVP
jgi:FlaA1/EpsC-like NDP-sugar epimerase